MNDFYKILGVEKDAPKSVIDAVFRALSKHHQSANPHFPMEKSKELIQIEQAYVVLSDPQKREKYDALLKQKEQMASQKNVDAPVAAPPIPQENTKPTPAPLPQQAAQQDEPDAPEDTSNTPNAINPTIEADEQEDELQQAYTALIGDKSTEYYLDEFAHFDEQQEQGKTSWFGSMNWFAGLFTVPWMLYRKMYVWGVVFGIAVIILNNIFLRFLMPPNMPILIFVYLAVIIVFFGKIGNRLYYNECRKKISISQKIRNKQKQFNDLEKKGGITYVPIYIFGAIVIAGILAAVALPSMADKNKPKPAVVQPTRQQEKPWEQYSHETEKPWKKYQNTN